VNSTSTFVKDAVYHTPPKIVYTPYIGLQNHNKKISDLAVLSE